MQIVVGQRDVGGLDGHVGTGQAHRDPDIGGGQRRGVVDAVADHADDVTLALQPAHHLELVLWHHLGAPLLDAELVGDHLGDIGMISGEHDDASNTVGPQLSSAPRPPRAAPRRAG